MKWKTTDDIINKILCKVSPCKDEIEKVWNCMEESKNASIETMKDGEIILKVKNSAYLQILTFKREEIKRNFNDKLDYKIKNIKIRLGG